MSKNKTFNKFSKKTIGEGVDTVADYIDIISQMIAEYFNQRYKIKKKAEDFKKATINALYALKTSFVRSIVEALFLTTGILSLVVGLIILISKIVPLEYVLIGYGLLVTIGILFTMKTKY